MLHPRQGIPCLDKRLLPPVINRCGNVRMVADDAHSQMLSPCRGEAPRLPCYEPLRDFDVPEFLELWAGGLRLWGAWTAPGV